MMNQTFQMREIQLDFLKTLAMYAVVLYHFNLLKIEIAGQPALNLYIPASLLSLGVPLFFFVNGYLLLKKDVLDLRSHIRKILRILVITLVWSAITLIAVIPAKAQPLTVTDFLYSVYFLKHKWNNHLWYMGTLLMIYMFHPLLHLAFKQQYRAFLFFFACVMMFTFGNKFLGMVATTAAQLYGKNYAGELIINYGSIYNPFTGIYAYAIGYFMLGGMASRKHISHAVMRQLKIWAWPLLLISTLLLGYYGVVKSKADGAIWDNGFEAYDSIFTLVNVGLLYLLTKGLIIRKKRLARLVTVTGQNTLGIYFVHYIIGWYLLLLFKKIPYHTTAVANLMFATLVLFASLAVVLIIKSIPFLKKLVEA